MEGGLAQAGHFSVPSRVPFESSLRGFLRVPLESSLRGFLSVPFKSSL